MIFDDNSSNSGDSDDFGGLIKKVDYDVQLQDSDEPSEQLSINKKKRKNYSKRISSLLNADESEYDKTKTIKKNCVSAKMSRERKKLYIQLLQKKATDLKEQILLKKRNIGKNRDEIMRILKQTNIEKFQFVQQSLKDSRNLVKQVSKAQQQQNKQKIQLMINSYLYKFGFNGVLRKDVVQLLKERWYELVINQKVLENGKQEELRVILQKFQKCMQNLQSKNQKMEKLFRKLQKTLPPQDIIKIIVKKQYFMSAQPIVSCPQYLDMEMQDQI